MTTYTQRGNVANYSKVKTCNDKRIRSWHWEVRDVNGARVAGSAEYKKADVIAKLRNY